MKTKGPLGEPTTKIEDDMDCPLLCGAAFRKGTLRTDVNVHIDSHSEAFPETAEGSTP